MCFDGSCYLFFIFSSVCFSVFSFLTISPLISAFLLVFTLLAFVPAVSLIGYVWVAYLVALLFLSGVFVLLIYLSSLSGFKAGSIGRFTPFILISLLFTPFLISSSLSLSLGVIYNPSFLCVFLYIVLGLFIFLVFISSLLTGGGPLRSL